MAFDKIETNVLRTQPFLAVFYYRIIRADD